MKTKRKPDGSRWAIYEKFDIMDIVDTSAVYLRRWYLIDTPYFGVYLHKINMPDPDRPLHDHPWNFKAVVLRGGYTELVPGGENVHRVGRINNKKAESLHRIKKLLRVPTWTLIFVGRCRREWGFATDQGWVQWDDYIRASEYPIKEAS